ncbi:MAG: hypothetical protein JST04_08905 [Bdellovibrionales bacterium]|nr:hypothetical protein [Bdellovibrionales bacterium]
MANEKKLHIDAFLNLSECVVSSLETMKDDEYLAEFGSEVKEDAKRGRELIAKSLKNFKQRHLTAARSEYARQMERIQTRAVSMPKTETGRRNLLLALMSKRPDMHQGLLTAQYRNLKELPDLDVSTALEQLAELGIWDGIIPEDFNEE